MSFRNSLGDLFSRLQSRGHEFAEQRFEYGSATAEGVDFCCAAGSEWDI